MGNRLKNGIALSIVPQIFLVQWLSGHPEWVERYYSNGIYPWISVFFRFLFGWLPFSIGELLYLSLFFFGVGYLIKKRRDIKAKPLLFLRDIALVVSVFYATFHLVWGFNYYRLPLAAQLEIQDSISKKELMELTHRLIAKTNEIQFEITQDSSAIVKVPYDRNTIFQMSIKGYDLIHRELPFLRYHRPSIKKSIYSTPSSYLGIGGYLNPFTNEAQVNALIPLFRFPVISGHEMGHQVGYAAENETNFIGYLVTVKHEDIYFRYTAYAYALSYCLRTISEQDKDAFDRLYKKVNPGTKKNYKELRDFYDSYANPLEPLFETVLSSFLKANNQKDGIHSYGKVVSLLVGYHKKHPL